MIETGLSKKAYILLLIGVLAVSTAAILIRFALPYAGSLAISFYRMFFSSIIAVVVYRLSKEHKKLSELTARQIILLILAGIFLALHFSLWTWSLELLSVSSSVFFVTTTPLWVGLFSPLIFKEKVGSQFYLGVLTAIFGGLIIAFLKDNLSIGIDANTSFFGLILALSGAWMASAYLIIGKKLSNSIPSKLYVTIVYAISSLVLGIFMVVEQGKAYVVYHPIVYGLFLLMAVIPQSLGHTSFNTALKYLPAGIVSLALLCEPIGSTILAILLLNEMPSIAELIGGIFILVGLIIAIKPQPNVA
jgi:drug/metabolite transporter (DMT)-like permease